MAGATKAEVYAALRKLISEAESGRTTALRYAVNYARNGLQMSGDCLQIQILYVLTNVSHWRGDVAREVKATLRSFKI